jgi:transcription elongation factor S-II
MSLRTHIASIIDKHLGELLSQDQRTDLERGIYNAALKDATQKGIKKHWENPDFADIYKVVARRAIVNLDPKAYVGNERLIQRLQDGEFQCHKVPFMTAKELYPEHWQPLADEQMKRENTMLEGDKEGGSDMFKCKRCGKSKTKYWEMQTRSADEPMTIFIRCLNCGKEWRQ